MHPHPFLAFPPAFSFLFLSLSISPGLCLSFSLFIYRFDHKGWYDRKNLSFFEITDSVIVAAMGPPGGGRTEISNRVLRHFNLLTYTAMEDSSVATIFTTLMRHFFSSFTEDLQVTNASRLLLHSREVSWKISSPLWAKYRHIDMTSIEGVRTDDMGGEDPLKGFLYREMLSHVER